MPNETSTPDVSQTGAAGPEPTEPTDQTSTAEQAEEQVETDIRSLFDKIQTLTDERDKFQDLVLRTTADFQNFRRRNQAEMSQFRLLATESFARDLLPVLDNLERSIAHLKAGASVETVIEGVRALERQMRQVLEGQNIKRIEAIGKPFDPELHEALGTEESDEHPEETVVSELEPGYKMGDKVIRPARVKVAKRVG